jgi:hypothetical protein
MAKTPKKAASASKKQTAKMLTFNFSTMVDNAKVATKNLSEEQVRQKQALYAWCQLASEAMAKLKGVTLHLAGVPSHEIVLIVDGLPHVVPITFEQYMTLNTCAKLFRKRGFQKRLDMMVVKGLYKMVVEGGAV